MADRKPRYRTGNEQLDAAITALVASAGVHRDTDLVFEMVVSALRMGREAVDRGDLKLVNSALKELRYSFLVFEPYEDVRKVAIFGSARTSTTDPGYELARDFAQRIADEGWMVITGAGPGIMEAGIEGAGADRAFGVNIVLPFETDASPLLAGDRKLINYRYFFTRKLTFMKESSASCLLPGGFGTMDEAFELLTLVQTGRSPMEPIVLLEPHGEEYWTRWRHFVETDLAARGLISADDLSLFRLCHDPREAVEEITRFYSVFHSQRYVGRRLVFRLTAEPPADLLAELGREFADIVVAGGIERVDVSRQELDDGDVPDLPRIAFQFNRRHYARLRHLIDRLNSSVPTTPAGDGRPSRSTAEPG
jgi:uncharacterized protein (TIGR00730 family)